jgi:glycosyltransferase involved in cell wall biosynthesis
VWQAAWEKHCPSIKGRRYFLFLGRLHSKKGVDLLLRAYAKVAREFPTTNGGTAPDLVVAGPCHSGSYLTSLKEIAARAGVATSVHWPGMVEGDAKWGALSGADAFVLPSHQENFGIAVVEALACGTPALISNRVNIWSELSSDEAALVESDDETGTLRLLQRWLALTPTARGAMSAAARASFRRRFEISYASQNLADQLAELLGKSSTPESRDPVE